MIIFITWRGNLPMNLLISFDFCGTIAFAISGAITAIDHRMDIFGVNMLAITTATGGGMLRDIIMGNLPPVMFRNPVYVLGAAITANVVFLLSRKWHHVPEHLTYWYDLLLFWFDTVGLAAFTVDGALLGLDSRYGSNLFFVTVLAFLTGVGGGLLRDVFSGQVPYIFCKHVYAVASIAGGLLTGIFICAGVTRWIGTAAGFVTVILIRYLARKFEWNLPRADD
ncbi:MAG: trimeric intracellular cation channel family protein [Bilifractor sp.]